MRLYQFSPAAGREITQYGSYGAVLARVLRNAGPVAIACFYLEPKGVIGRHPTVGAQLLLVMSGSAAVSGADSAVAQARPGTAVYWQAGEVHETHAGPAGLVAIVVEGAALDPADAMPLLEG